MPPMTRGPLPPGVYWRRRFFVLALAATLVFVIANLLGGGSDGKDDDVPAARQVGGELDASQTITVGEKHKDRKGRRHRGEPQGPTFDPAVMAEPDGNCDPADIRVTPQVEGAVAGDPVAIALALQTVQAEACYFRVGSDKVTVTISRGGREIWTSRECPDPVPEESVVVRRAIATVVQMTWDGRESDSSCSHRRHWLMDGAGFTITAAALGGEPADSTFDLASPTPETVTVTPDPKRDKKGDRDERDGDTTGATDATEEPSDQSTDEPRR